MTNGWATGGLIAGSTASAQKIPMFPVIPDSLSKYQTSSAAMRERLAKVLYEARIFSTASSLAVLSGSFSDRGRSLMNDPLGYMKIAAGIVEQFRSVAEIANNNSVSRVTAEGVFKSFFRRMCDGFTLEALSTVVEFPTGGESTMIRFLEHLKALPTQDVSLTGNRRHLIETVIQNLTRHLKSMEIASPFLDQCGRTFIWTERGIRMAARDQIPNKELYKDEVKQWSGKAHRKEKLEPRSAIDEGVLSIFQMTYKKGTEMEIYFWQIKLSEDGLVVNKGFAGSLEDAADGLYRAFYRALSKKRYVDATAVQPGTELVVFGNWITNAEYMAYKNKQNLIIISDASDDSRDDLIFVVNWPELGKQKALVKAHKVRKARNYGEMNSDNVIIELRSGYTLDATDHFYVYRAERFVSGEIMCMQCTSVGTIGSMGCVAVYGRGIHCGPCIDHLMGEEKLEADTFDMSDVVMPVDTQTLVSMSEEEIPSD